MPIPCELRCTACGCRRLAVPLRSDAAALVCPAACLQCGVTAMWPARWYRDDGTVDIPPEVST